MTLTDEQINFFHRFFSFIFDDCGDCLYIADCDTKKTDLIVSSDGDIIDYSEIKSGEFEGIKWDGFFGASKAVFSFDNFDFVIKIPYNGCFTFSEEDDEINYIDMPNHIIIEEEIYEDASNIMKSILLKNEFAFIYKNLEVYIQKKIFETEDEKYNTVKGREHFFSYSKKIQDGVKEARNLSKGYYLPCDNFLAAIADQHLNEFISIIKEMDFNDMHNGNYGYLDDGTAVIFDYAGYCESAWI